MKIKDIIVEAKDAAGPSEMRDDAVAALPGAEYWPELDNSSGYLAYRFGVQLAGMPGHPAPIASPTGLKMVTIAYTAADKAILDATGKHMKTKGYQLSPNASEEGPGVNNKSLVQAREPVKLKK